MSVDSVLRAHGIEPNWLGWLDRWAARRLVKRYTMDLHRKDRIFVQSERTMNNIHTTQYYQGRYNERFHPSVRTYPQSTDDGGHRTVFRFGLSPITHVCVHCGEVDPDDGPCPNRGEPDSLFWLED